MDSLLQTIRDKIAAGAPLSRGDGIALMRHPNLLGIGAIANALRERLHGNVTYYNRNLHLNATNVCEANCLFCSFSRPREDMPQAYTMSVEAARMWMLERYRPGMSEVHVVNGLNPHLPFEYYEELLRMIRGNFPALHIKAFTAVEIHYFTGKFGMSCEQVLRRLMAAGLGSLPGGGAEVFSPRVRRKICRDKADADRWLDVHRTAHRLGLKSNCTMLYGTIETDEERIDHLLRLRALQEETHGFQAFVPLAFHNEDNRMGHLPPPTAVEDLRIIAVSRLMLHNIAHLKAYWVALGEKIAQTAQLFGANDIDGTVTEEKICHMAGAHAPPALTLERLRRIIRLAGREPVERNTMYRRMGSSLQHVEQQACAQVANAREPAAPPGAGNGGAQSFSIQ